MWPCLFVSTQHQRWLTYLEVCSMLRWLNPAPNLQTLQRRSLCSATQQDPGLIPAQAIWRRT